jgi:hypothetical protein
MKKKDKIIFSIIDRTTEPMYGYGDGRKVTYIKKIREFRIFKKRIFSIYYFECEI